MTSDTHTHTHSFFFFLSASWNGMSTFTDLDSLSTNPPFFTPLFCFFVRTCFLSPTPFPCFKLPHHHHLHRRRKGVAKTTITHTYTDSLPLSLFSSASLSLHHSVIPTTNPSQEEAPPLIKKRERKTEERKKKTAQACTLQRKPQARKQKRRGEK